MEVGSPTGRVGEQRIPNSFHAVNFEPFSIIIAPFKSPNQELSNDAGMESFERVLDSMINNEVWAPGRTNVRHQELRLEERRFPNQYHAVNFEPFFIILVPFQSPARQPLIGLSSR